MIRKVVLAGMGCVAVPLLCSAAASPDEHAVSNCARTQADLLHFRVTQVSNELAYPVETAKNPYGSWHAWSAATQEKDIVMTARDKKGKVLNRMVCTVDRNGNVVRFRTAPAADIALELER